MKRILFIILYLTFLIPALAQAGIVIEEISYDKNNPKDEEKTVTYISANRVKVVQSEGEYELWDLNKGTIYLVNPQKKIYSGGEAIEVFIKEMKESIQKMQQEMGVVGMLFKKTTPAKSGTKEKVIVKNTAQTITIAGYPAVKYEVYRGKKLDEEVWLAKDVEIKKELDYKKFEKLARELERAMEVEFGLSSSAEEEIDTTELDRLYEQGFVLKSIDHSINGVTEVTKVYKRDIPAKEFQVPAGYRKLDTQLFMELEEEDEEDDEDDEEEY